MFYSEDKAIYVPARIVELLKERLRIRVLVLEIMKEVEVLYTSG